MIFFVVACVAVAVGCWMLFVRLEDGVRQEEIAVDEALVRDMNPVTVPLPEVAPVPAATTDAVIPLPVRMPILVYHSIKPYKIGETLIQRTYQVEPAVFERQMQYLGENGYSPIVPDDLTAYFQDGKPLPPKPVMVNFDDGWENQFEYARPILEKYKVRATFYVFSNPIGKDKRFMTWEQLKELRALGMVIGAHSKSHPFLTKIADDKALAEEIAGSKRRLEDALGAPVTSFCYPFGLHDQRIDDEVRRAGFASARGLRNYVVISQADLFDLDGFIITENFSRFTRILEGGK